MNLERVISQEEWDTLKTYISTYNLITGTRKSFTIEFTIFVNETISKEEIPCKIKKIFNWFKKVNKKNFQNFDFDIYFPFF
jgi:hypothetical protein